MGPDRNIADSVRERKTLLPAETLNEVQQGFDVLLKRAQERIMLLEEMFRATSFSEWADIFSVWLVEKKGTLSRYTMPNSVAMAQVRSGESRGGEGREREGEERRGGKGK